MHPTDLHDSGIRAPKGAGDRLRHIGIATKHRVGHTVRRQVVSAEAIETTLNLSGLPPGLYVVRTDNQTARLVVE